MSTFTERMIGAARLDAAIYEEVEHDPDAIGQAVGVVVLSSLAAGIGSMLYTGVLQGLVLGTVAALVGWVIWAFLTWIIGTRLLPEEGTEADMGQLLRTIGFSAAPGILRVFGLIPLIGGPIMLICNIWMLVTMVIGVRQALDYTSTWRAAGVCVIGWIALVIVQMLAFTIFGTPGPGPATP
ncbi:MAG TPA: YIP1 family protein [Gammaproteobacteria bacterium]|nr:YIP1 family protein [Gammaproteobacteria bacterium]